MQPFTSILVQSLLKPALSCAVVRSLAYPYSPPCKVAKIVSLSKIVRPISQSSLPTCGTVCAYCLQAVTVCNHARTAARLSACRRSSPHAVCVCAYCAACFFAFGCGSTTPATSSTAARNAFFTMDEKP